MGVIDSLTATSPKELVYATTGGVQAFTPITSGAGVQIVPGLDDRILRLPNTFVRLDSLADFTGDKTFTAAAWIRIPPGDTTRRIWDRTNGSTSVRFQVAANGVPQAIISSTAGGYTITLSGSTRVDDDNWHFICLVSTSEFWGGLDALFYVDGAEVRKGWIHPGLFGRDPNIYLDVPLWIGRGADGSSPFGGDIGAVAFWDYALSAATITQLSSAAVSSSGPRFGWGIPIG